MLDGREVEVDQVFGQLVYNVNPFRVREILQQRREVKEVGYSTDSGWRVRTIRGACVVLSSSAQSDGFNF